MTWHLRPPECLTAARYQMQMCLGRRGWCKFVMLVWHDSWICDSTWAGEQGPLSCHAKTQFVMRKTKHTARSSKTCHAGLHNIPVLRPQFVDSHHNFPDIQGYLQCIRAGDRKSSGQVGGDGSRWSYPEWKCLYPMFVMQICMLKMSLLRSPMRSIFECCSGICHARIRMK